jgi:hypothetical protein
VSPLRESKKKSLLAAPPKCKERPDFVAGKFNSHWPTAPGFATQEPFVVQPNTIRNFIQKIAGDVRMPEEPRRGTGQFREKLEARGGIEPPIKVLQTFALPLGDRAPSMRSTFTRAE